MSENVYKDITDNCNDVVKRLGDVSKVMRGVASEPLRAGAVSSVAQNIDIVAQILKEVVQDLVPLKLEHERVKLMGYEYADPRLDAKS